MRGQEEDDDKPEGEAGENGVMEPREDRLKKEGLINRNQMVAHYTRC